MTPLAPWPDGTLQVFRDISLEQGLATETDFFDLRRVRLTIWNAPNEAVGDVAEAALRSWDNWSVLDAADCLLLPRVAAAFREAHAKCVEKGAPPARPDGLFELLRGSGHLDKNYKPVEPSLAPGGIDAKGIRHWQVSPAHSDFSLALGEADLGYVRNILPGGVEYPRGQGHLRTLRNKAKNKKIADEIFEREMREGWPNRMAQALLDYLSGSWFEVRLGGLAGSSMGALRGARRLHMARYTQSSVFWETGLYLPGREPELKADERFFFPLTLAAWAETWAYRLDLGGALAYCVQTANLRMHPMIVAHARATDYASMQEPRPALGGGAWKLIRAYAGVLGADRKELTARLEVIESEGATRALNTELEAWAREVDRLTLEELKRRAAAPEATP